MFLKGFHTVHDIPENRFLDQLVTRIGEVVEPVAGAVAEVPVAVVAVAEDAVEIK